MLSFLITLALVINLTNANEVSLGTVIVNSNANSSVSGDVSREDLSSFSSVIKKESFQTRSSSLSDVIEQESSVQTKQSGGLGSFSSLSLRGATSNQVMVFMDGVPLNDASNGSVDLSTIPMSEVESIEIYKGITPINFGKSSIGGAVNIKTKRSQDEFKTDITAGYGSFNTFRFSPFISYKPGKFDYLISGDYQSSKNNFSFLNNNGTQWNNLDDRWENRNNNQFIQGNILFSFGYDLSKDTRLIFSNQYFSKDQNLPSWNNSPDTKTSLDTKRNLANLKLIVNNVGTSNLNSASRFDYSYKKEIYDDRSNSIGLASQYNEYRTSSYGYNQYLQWPTQHNIIEGVLDLHRDDYKIQDLLNIQKYSPSSRNFYSLSTEDKIILFNDKLILSPALIFEYYYNNFESSSYPRNESHGYVNPKMGLKYSVLNWMDLKTNVARYVREPSFFELFGDRGFFNGNPDLKAERGLNFDAGTEIKYSPYGYYLSRISFNTAYFRSGVSDVISYVYNSRGVGQAVNISNSIINGIENSLVMEFFKNVSLTSNYTWQSAINDNIIKAFNGKQLPGRFQHSASNKIEYTAHLFKTYYELLYASGLYYDSANLLPAPIKREHNLGITFFMNSFILTAEVKNIGNDHYEDFNGYPQPGRSYWLTARFEQ
ncbi:MAG: TonB-dependent receptor [bacterium]